MLSIITTAVTKVRARLDSFAARARDAVRTFRGKPPKHSPLARQFAGLHHASYAPRPVAGICTDADVAVGAMNVDEWRFLKKLVRSVAGCDGPVVQFGTLLGEVSAAIGEVKTAAQLIVAVDPLEANPWGMTPTAYRTIVERILEPVVESGHVVRSTQNLNGFFRTQQGCQPALVFLNYVPNPGDAEQIIAWAIASGAQVIAGRGYDYSQPAMIQLIDKMGGPQAIEGNIWQLDRRPLGTRGNRRTTSASGQPEFNANSADGLVSIVMPAYDARPFIASTLRDVEAQLYGNWELVVIEDGSADDIEDVVERFALQHVDHRVVYRGMPRNVGVSRARNEAMKDCRGEFVAFFDADDRWSRDHLQRKVRLLNRTACDIAYSRVEMFDSDTGQPLCTWGPSEEDLRRFPDSMFRAPYLQPSGVVVRRSLIADVGGFDEELAFAEDYDYWFRAVRAGKKFCFDEKVTSRYRKNHASAATTDRLVLCHDGIADVARRHMAQLEGHDTHRERVVAKHFLAAGTGHLAYRPSRRNRCSPDRGVQLLSQACHIGEKRWDQLAYYVLAKAATATRTTPLIRPLFRKRFRRCLREL